MIVYEVTLNSEKIIRCKGLNENNALKTALINKNDVKKIKRLYNENIDEYDYEDDFFDTATDIISTGIALGNLFKDLDSNNNTNDEMNDSSSFGGFGDGEFGGGGSSGNWD